MIDRILIGLAVRGRNAFDSARVDDRLALRLMKRKLRYNDQAAGAFDPDDDGRLIPIYEADEDDYDDLLPDEPVDRAALARRVADLDEREREVLERIEDRIRHGATEESLRSDRQLLDALQLERDDLGFDVEHADELERRRASEREPAGNPRGAGSRSLARSARR